MRLFCCRPLVVAWCGLFCVSLGLVSSSSFAAPYFEDGYLGLTQAELHHQLGMPHAVRDRKSALRVFTYYAIPDWEKYFRRLISPENGEDVYTYTRQGISVRYSFSYTVDPMDTRENRTLFVRLVDVEFSPPVSFAMIPTLVPEFHPSINPTAPTFRSNIWVLLFSGMASPHASFIIKEPTRDKLTWTLAYQLFSLQGLSDPLTTISLVDRLEMSAQSVEFVQQQQRHTHDPTPNPYATTFLPRLPANDSPRLKIPLPKYAD